MSDLYESDFFAWAAEQAALLRAGSLSEADAAHIAEELDSMGRAEREQLTNRLGVLLAHLLKWQSQPARRGNSWRLTIREQRRRVARLLAQNPSLRAQVDAILADAYGDAVLMAARETGLSEDSFPAQCPWSLDAALSDAEPSF